MSFYTMADYVASPTAERYAKVTRLALGLGSEAEPRMGRRVLELSTQTPKYLPGTVRRRPSSSSKKRLLGGWRAKILISLLRTMCH